MKKIKVKENKIVIIVNPIFYSLEAIYSAAYIFIDRAYLLLNESPKNQVAINIKGKEKLTKKQLEDLAGEFCNELLNCALRDKISKNNQKIREQIITRALFSAEETSNEKINKKIEKEKWQKDTLGIALPWKEKYGKSAQKQR